MAARKEFRSAGIVLCLLTAGCTMVGPDFEPPEVDVADSWLEAHDPKVDTSTEAYKDWWSVFNDPILNALIEKAYAQNLNLQAAGLRILQARAQLGIATGQQYPQSQSIQSSYTRSRSSENAPPFANLPPTLDVDNAINVWQTDFAVSWEADVWGKFRRNIQAADANLAGSMLNYDAVLVTLTGDVALTYTNIRTLEQRLAYTRDNLKLQQRGLQIARDRFEFGATSELDVQQSLSQVKGTESTIPVLELNIRTAKNALSLLMGMPPSDLQTILGTAGGIPKAPVQAAVGIPNDLIRRRPDVRAAEMAAAAQSALIGVAQSDLYPQFVLAGSIGVAGVSFSDQFDSGSGSGFFTPLINWNIFNYGRIRNNVRAQDAAFQQLVVNYQNVVLNAAREVEDGLIGFLRSQQQAAFLEEAIKASQRSVVLSLDQYEAGATDYQRVLTSQASLLSQQDSVAQAEGNTVASLVTTYRALGGGWQLHEGKPWVDPKTLELMRERTNWGDLLDDQIGPAK